MASATGSSRQSSNFICFFVHVGIQVVKLSILFHRTEDGREALKLLPLFVERFFAFWFDHFQKVIFDLVSVRVLQFEILLVKHSVFVVTGPFVTLYLSIQKLLDLPYIPFRLIVIGGGDLLEQMFIRALFLDAEVLDKQIVVHVDDLDRQPGLVLGIHALVFEETACFGDELVGEFAGRILLLDEVVPCLRHVVPECVDLSSEDVDQAECRGDEDRECFDQLVVVVREEVGQYLIHLFNRVFEHRNGVELEFVPSLVDDLDVIGPLAFFLDDVE